MELSLKKQAEQAPKFVIELFKGVYAAPGELQMTDDITEAHQYSIGFDNANLKLSFWSALFGCKAKIINL